MSILRSPRFAARIASLVLLVLFLGATASRASAATLGFVERFPDTSIGTWGGGAVNVNPGTDGFGGAGDGFLSVKTPNGFQHNLGARSSGAPYLGSWTAANIKQVRLWLKDIGPDDPLEMHFSVGLGTNLWQYNVAFLPPEDHWAEFVVDLTNAANWTRIVGTTGTFANALAAVEVVHVRHDHAPFVQTPDPLDGDFGLDHILLTDGLLGVPRSSTVPRALALTPPAPNPSRGDVTLSLEAFEDGPVQLEIVDASGRIVRRFAHASGGPGTRVWTWDGRDGTGRLAPPGYYRVRATGPSGGMSRALVRID